MTACSETSMAYPTAAEKAVLHDVEKLMLKTMAKYDPSHDSYHVQRVRKTAVALAKAMSAQSPRQLDFLVVEIAALLHDVCDRKYVPAETAANPYAFFLPFFQKVSDDHGLDLVGDGRAKVITEIIRNVSWTTEKKLLEEGLISDWHRECLELHCVQDADRLDAIGALGVMRCAAYSVVMNRPLHVPPSEYQEKNSAIRHFETKLLHIRDRLKTEPGKRLGEQRHQLLLDFMASVEQEYAAEIPGQE